MPNHYEEPVSVTISAGIINLQQGSKQKYPLSISQWTDAFLVFTCIYLEKYPIEAKNLLKYCSIIRDMQRLTNDNTLRQYDENFRRLKQAHDLPWQKPVEELRMKTSDCRGNSWTPPRKLYCIVIHIYFH